jgi:valyl-tRNA synthetase
MSKEERGAMESRYDAKALESEIYRKWEESGYFNPDVLVEKEAVSKDAEPFTIIMPPPNANGSLHAGHALFLTMQDIMTRFARMQGRRALWLPGADHAGFETQIVYEKKLEKEGRSRFGMDPQELYAEILDFTLANKSHMEGQIRSLGSSCDWSREKFTLDPEIVKQVQATFKKMFEDGLIYRGARIVNWCSKHQTSLSDVETEFKEKKEPFYYFQYGPFVISTSRPETKFGDKYVVMHPSDERYKAYEHGQKIGPFEWITGPATATVIKDEAIDMEFGTGVMTITPWHDATDFEIAQRHGLDKEQIIDFYGKLLPIAGEFAGMKIAEARPKIVAKLAEKGLLVKTDEAYEHTVRVCYKCETPIEPQIKDQWFVKMEPLAKLALDAVARKELRFVPERYEKVFTYWMEHTIDWNISRQIVWGIPIPAKICEKCGAGTADLDDSIKTCSACGGDMRKETDTFDTWFSSGQWPFLTLGYPEHKDFDLYYPTDVMETGGDLIFKWVPRMVFMSLYMTGKTPFHTVYLHGLVNDAKGKKMSKSKGNVMDPLVITDKYGTDALRMALIVGNPPGAEMALSEDKVRGYRNFATKIWNAARFVLMSRPEGFTEGAPKNAAQEASLKELLEQVKPDIAKHFLNFEYHLAAEKAYHYFWHTFADVLIEREKEILKNGTPEEKAASYEMLETILLESLTILHPFVPFVTEAVYEKLLDARGGPAPDKNLPEFLMIRRI